VINLSLKKTNNYVLELKEIVKSMHQNKVFGEQAGKETDRKNADLLSKQ